MYICTYEKWLQRTNKKQNNSQKGRTELILRRSGAKKCAERHGNVRFGVAPQKPDKICKNYISGQKFASTICSVSEFSARVWDVFGTCSGRVRDVFGTCSDVFGTCSGRVRAVFGTCLGRVRDVFGTCSGRVQVLDVFGACLGRVRDVFGAFMGLFRDASGAFEFNFQFLRPPPPRGPPPAAAPPKPPQPPPPPEAPAAAAAKIGFN